MVSHAVRTGVTITIITTTPRIGVARFTIIIITNTPRIGAARFTITILPTTPRIHMVPYALIKGVPRIPTEAPPTETLSRTPGESLLSRTADPRGFAGPKATTQRAARPARDGTRRRGGSQTRVGTHGRG